MISENLKLTEKYTKHQFFVRKIERIFSSPGIEKQLRELSGKLETKIKAVILSEHYIEMFANAQSNFFLLFCLFMLYQSAKLLLLFIGCPILKFCYKFYSSLK